jgi:hypothetical protein
MTKAFIFISVRPLGLTSARYFARSSEYLAEITLYACGKIKHARDVS